MLSLDLDFGNILAITKGKGPSVLQIRCQDLLPDHLESIVVAALRQHEAELRSGALVVADETTLRVRIRPTGPAMRPVL